MKIPLEELARVLSMGDYDDAHEDKSHWIETRGHCGGRYRDINEPMKCDYMEAAERVAKLIDQYYD